MVQKPPTAEPATRQPSTTELADLLWRPLPSGNSFEWTVQRLAQAIRFGVVRSGERLPAERVLADRLHVGRETVREAIRALRDAGLVRTARGRSGGTFVVGHHAAVLAGDPREVGVERIRDVLALRGVLEGGAVRLAAARNLDDVTIADLSACLDEALIRSPHRSVACTRLHLMLAAASGSPSLLTAIMDVHTQLDGMFEQLPPLAAHLDRADEFHRTIVAAVLGGEPELARDEMELHCESTALLLDGLIS